MPHAFLVPHGDDGRPGPTLLVISPGPIAQGPTVTESETTGPVVACPLSCRSVPYPVVVRDGSLSLAECADCDLYFEAKPVDHHTKEIAPDHPGKPEWHI
jgi:hypothetical protein